MSSCSSSSIDRSHPSLELSFMPTPLQVVQLLPSTPLPSQLLEILSTPSQSFISLSRTPQETSLILPTSLLPSLFPPSGPAPHESEGPWSCIVVKGPMNLSLTGIMHALCGPLKQAQVPVFASSTWDTDYVLIKEDKRERARKALIEDGWKFSN